MIRNLTNLKIGTQILLVYQPKVKILEIILSLLHETNLPVSCAQVLPLLCRPCPKQDMGLNMCWVLNYYQCALCCEVKLIILPFGYFRGNVEQDCLLYSWRMKENNLFAIIQLWNYKDWRVWICISKHY